MFRNLSVKLSFAPQTLAQPHTIAPSEKAKRLPRSVAGWLLCGVLGVLGLTGCQEKSAVNPVAIDPTAVTTDQPGSKLPDELSLRTGVTTLDGNWVMVLTDRELDRYVWLVQFGRDAEGKLTATMLDAERDPGKPVIESVSEENGEVRLTAASVRGPVPGVDRFVGTFANEQIRGTQSAGKHNIIPTRFLPTTLETLKAAPEAAGAPDLALFKAAGTDKRDPGRALWKVAQQSQQSPLALNAYQSILQNLRILRFTPAEQQELMNEYLLVAQQWGKPMHAAAEYNLAVRLLREMEQPRAALDHFAKAEELLGEQRPQWDTEFKTYRDYANIKIAMEELESTDVAERKSAYDRLLTARKEEPFNPEVLEAVAGYAEQSGDVTTATEVFAEILAIPLLKGAIEDKPVPKRPEAALPGQPKPLDRFNALWTQQHGSLAGSQEFVQTTYDRIMGDLFTKITTEMQARPAAAPAQRMVLMEVFTGVNCPPCVAADLASEIVSRNMPTEQLVMLQYHQHIPAPDPLTNQDTEDRGSGYYAIPGAPAVYLDGRPVEKDGRIVESLGGPMQLVPIVAEVLHGAIQQRAAVPAPLKLSLSAVVNSDQLQVAAGVEGLDPAAERPVRLRLALAESVVKITGMNGVREHRMVVREMLGGAKGIAPKKGELNYAIELPLVEIQQHLMEYLDKFESGSRMVFPEKPLALKDLWLVAFVQDDETKEVLCTSVVPVAGAYTFPPLPERFLPAATPAVEVMPTPDSSSPATTSSPAETTAAPAVTTETATSEPAMTPDPAATPEPTTAPEAPVTPEPAPAVPAEPMPAEPPATPEPTPAEPATIVPFPTEPPPAAPVEPAPAESTPVEPIPTEPAPVAPEPAPAEPTP